LSINGKTTWWIKRIGHNLQLYDVLRVDHFRGFAAYWEVPASDKTAVHGSWVRARGKELFEAARERLGKLPIIAEDVGYITEDVRELMKALGFPGMKILQFAFYEDMKNPYLPHHYSEDCVVYVGTHDNNTTKGWFSKELSESQKSFMASYLGREVNQNNVHRELIRTAMESKARLAVFTLQDVLGLGEAARMNVPGTARGNWRWRLTHSLDGPAVRNFIKLTESTHRAAK